MQSDGGLTPMMNAFWGNKAIVGYGLEVHRLGLGAGGGVYYIYGGGG